VVLRPVQAENSRFDENKRMSDTCYIRRMVLTPRRAAAGNRVTRGTFLILELAALH